MFEIANIHVLVRVRRDGPGVHGSNKIKRIYIFYKIKVLKNWLNYERNKQNFQWKITKKKFVNQLPNQARLSSLICSQATSSVSIEIDIW